jgi:DNA-binding ferritin-like protein
MPYINVHVDLDEIYDDMDRRDKQEIAEWLNDDGILSNHPNAEIRKLVRGKEESNGEKDLRDDLTKIWNSYYQLTNEEELLIKQIANRL